MNTLYTGACIFGGVVGSHLLRLRYFGSSSARCQAVEIINKLESIVQRDEGKRGIKELIIPGELYRSALTLMESKNVAIITGFPCMLDFDPPTETDGPLGALAIARSLIGAGKSVVIVTDECNSEPILAAAGGAGLAPEQFRLECFAGGIGFDEGESKRLRDLGR